MRIPLRSACLALLLIAPAVHAAPAVYRFSDLDLRDPHVFFNFIGCRDVTDNALVGFSVNGQMQANIQSDADSNGTLDLSYLLVFDSADPNAADGAVTFRTGACTAPMAGTSCGPDASAPVAFTYTRSLSGTCLAPLAGTVRPYTPAVTNAVSPCFSTSAGTVTINMGGIPLTLHDARIGATFVGSPAGSLVNGLLTGFISEADANNTTIPNTFPLVGGQPLSSILPGGTNACPAYSDKDLDAGVTGWWFDFNFVAAKVPYTDPNAGVENGAPVLEGVTAWPNPSRSSLSIRFRMPSPGLARVTMHDLQGREVAELARGPLPAGTHALRWDGRDAGGAVAPAGVYFVRIESAGQAVSRRVTLLR